MPDTGSRPTTAPRLIAAWPTIHVVTPAASSMPKRSGAVRATWNPTSAEPGEQPEHEQAADEAELLADDREDEVGVRVGEEHPLGPARAEPDAVDAAAAERDQRLRDLVAGVRRVGPRVEEREHARPAVRRRDREQRVTSATPAATERAPGASCRTPATSSIDDRDERRTRRSSRGRARGSRGSTRPPPTASTGLHARQSCERVGAARQDLGAEQQQRELRELARLHAQRPEAEPAPRAVDDDADAGISTTTSSATA